jgi:uncharacterized protein YjbI with pentapeptide repeats
MANRQQLSILKRGADKWNQWRQTQLRAGESPDLAKADLRGADLRGANLYRAILRGSDLSNADLRKADLGEADLSEANLSGADLRETVLSSAFCFQTDFSGANLIGADLHGILLAYANLLGAKLPGGLEAQRQVAPNSGVQSAIKKPDHRAENAAHRQAGTAINGGLPNGSEVEGEGLRLSPQWRLGKPAEVPSPPDLGQNQKTSEQRHVPEIDKILMPKISQRRKLVTKPPELGKEYVEGERRERLSQYYERNPHLRVAAIALHGTKCMVCGFDFEAVYGRHGAGYVEVHHLRRVSSLQAKTRVNPQTDMVVLCANCHRMIHRSRDGMLSPDELRSLIRR